MKQTTILLLALTLVKEVYPGFIKHRGPIKALGFGIGGKILGGYDAERGEFPFQVSWQSITGLNSCGGSVLNKNYILTAGHCCNGVDFSFQIVAGEYNIEEVDGTEQRRDVIQRIIHEDYDPMTIDNDVCIVQVDAPFEINDNVQPTELDSIGGWNGNVQFTVSGWGVTSIGGYTSDVLQKVSVPFVDESICEKSYEADGYAVTDGMICAGGVSGQDACQGDSGGPLTDSQSGIQVGIVSWGIGCGLPEYPGVYARVSYYYDWIVQHAF